MTTNQRLQYCKIGKHWAPPTDFYDELKGYHGNRTWCKYHTARYMKRHLSKKKRHQNMLIRFWNAHHKKQIPLVK